MNEANPSASPAPDADHVPVVTEEFDRARWTLPPIIPVIIALAVVAAAIAIFTLSTSKPKASGKIVEVYTQATPDGKRVLALVEVSFQNLDKAPMFLRDVQVQVKPKSQKPGDTPLEDRSAPVSDLNRYFQGFTDLAAHKGTPLPIDSKINSGESVQGTVLVAFPLSKEDFDQRQWLRVIIQPYDHLPITLQQ